MNSTSIAVSTPEFQESVASFKQAQDRFFEGAYQFGYDARMSGISLQATLLKAQQALGEIRTGDVVIGHVKNGWYDALNKQESGR